MKCPRQGRRIAADDRHSAAVLPVKQLRADEFLVGGGGQAVDFRDQLPVTVLCLFLFLTVIQDGGQPRAALHFAFVTYWVKFSFDLAAFAWIFIRSASDILMDNFLSFIK